MTDGAGLKPGSSTVLHPSTVRHAFTVTPAFTVPFSGEDTRSTVLAPPYSLYRARSTVEERPFRAASGAIIKRALAPAHSDLDLFRAFVVGGKRLAKIEVSGIKTQVSNIVVWSPRSGTN